MQQRINTRIIYYMNWYSYFIVIFLIEPESLTFGFAEVQGVIWHRHPERLSGINVTPRVIVAFLLGTRTDQGAHQHPQNTRPKTYGAHFLDPL